MVLTKGGHMAHGQGSTRLGTKGAVTLKNWKRKGRGRAFAGSWRLQIGVLKWMAKIRARRQVGRWLIDQLEGTEHLAFSSWASFAAGGP